MKSLWKINIFLKFFGLRYIPLVAFVGPKLIELSESRVVLMVPLKRRTKNHLRTMYFGALNIGAELSMALVCVIKIQESGRKVDFLFKDYKVNFLKRAEGDVHFIFENPGIVTEQVQKTIESGERLNQVLKGYAVVPSKSMTERVAEYELTLSVKRRG